MKNTRKKVAVTKKTSGSVINPLSRKELAKFLDTKSQDIIKYFIIKSLFSQPEPKRGQRQLPVQVPKEHIEQWFTQAFDVNPVGAGSYPIDIYNTRENWGADIKMLNIKVDKFGGVVQGDSGEASLGQNFSSAGVHLDTLFRNRRYEEIKDSWVSLFKEKYKSLKKIHPIKKVYYFFILRPGVQVGGANFYFCGASLDVSKLKAVSVNRARTTATSVFLENFISEELGNVKIYKAKKRLELRLRSKNWVDGALTIKISTSFAPSFVDLRGEKVDAHYLGNEIKKILKTKITFETQ